MIKFKLRRYRFFLFGILLPITFHPFTSAGNPDMSEASAILISPRSIVTGKDFRVLVSFDLPIQEVAIEVIGPSGALQSLSGHIGEGPLYWRSSAFRADESGTYRVTVKTGGQIWEERVVSINHSPSKRILGNHVWEIEQGWTRDWENLYSAWIERLFMDAPEGESWNPLHAVTRDPNRNLLYDHLGLGEDGEGRESLRLKPDCADNPYILRAYFAWKMGLPYGHHRCSYGSPGSVPESGEWITNLASRKSGAGDVEAFQAFVIGLLDTIHSGSAGTGLNSEVSDLYPVKLNRESLSPGTVFADPYGHTLMIVRWLDQEDNSAGKLLAVDAQPDGTIGIRRFWRGNFLFATDHVIGEPGFKAFRPILFVNDELRALNNRQIDDFMGKEWFSLQQQGLEPQWFYDTMDDLINPSPLDPVTAYHELHEAVSERLSARATAIENGERYMSRNRYQIVPMPDGRRIFQTTGPWEDYSTPSRDLRLLMALDILLEFPDKLIRRPESFRIPQGSGMDEVRSRLADYHTKWSRDIKIDYTGSNGIVKTLTLAEIIDRMEALEMGYNPNDCIEIRWGTPLGSPDMNLCGRRAPDSQREKMEAYRKWFKTRTFPVR